MEKKNSSGGGKKEFGNGEDLASIILSMNSLEFLAKEKQVHEYLSSLSMNEGLSMEIGEKSLKRKAKKRETNYNPSKRVKSEEGSNSSNSEDLRELGLAEGVNLPQRGKSRFDYLLEAVSIFSAYEEHCLQQSKLVRNKRNVGDEQEHPHEPDELPREFKEKIRELNGCEVKFVMEKKLFMTDLNPNNGRFSIPPSKIANNFLTQTEESSLNERLGRNKRLAGMPVFVLDPSLTEHNMCFKKWAMERGCVYNLTKGWNQIVLHNDLKLDDKLQLWSFRVSSQLCFALVKL
ncbi:putative B3 domain-containing protein [Spatholobus suberectus]|nr:putative B3 domain-containing protein [Spatholobus suberectus]